MNQPIMNPTDEQKEFYLNKIPACCRRTWFKVTKKSMDEVENIFELHSGDTFQFLDGDDELSQKYLATSDPYINKECIPTINCKKL